ncbi:MAG: hypothetical protein MK365_07710 [Vicinamibacterales bacterium]|nr:hypothetical protein [Vicinamibacterales bacterium]
MPASSQRTPTCWPGGWRLSATPHATTTTTSKTHVRREVAHRANLPESE